MAIQTLVSTPVFSPIRLTPTFYDFSDYATSPIQLEGLEAPTEHKRVDSSCLAAVGRCFSKYHGAQEQNLSMNPVGESGMAGVWKRKSIHFLVT